MRRFFGMTNAHENSAVSAGALISGVLFGAWIAVCDVWVKLLARSAGCEPLTPLGEAFGKVWEQPGRCPGIDIGGPLQLRPAVRAGIGPTDIALPDGTAQLWGLGLFAAATVVTILVLRWRWRISGDALALGALWSGVGILALPRLAGPGTAFAEVHIGELATGLGDLAIAWAVVWLGWRLIAELRA